MLGQFLDIILRNFPATGVRIMKPDESDSYGLSIHYQGNAYKDHLIDAEDLAISLLGLNQALDKVSKIVYGDDAGSSLKVRADLRQGSAVADLVFSIAPTAAVVLPEALSCAENVINVLTGFWELMKFLKGRSLTEAQTIPNLNGTTTINLNSKSITVHNMVINTYNGCSSLPDATAKTLRPLTSGNAESIEVTGTDNQVIASFSRQDAAEIIEQKQPEVSEKLSTVKTDVTIESLSFTPGQKWRVFAGGDLLHVSIQDDEFMKKVSNREISFRSGDQLSVSLTMMQNSGKKRNLFTFIVNRVYGWSHGEENLND